MLRDQLHTYLYPVHRIDAATSGVVLFALDSSSAAAIQRQFAQREISKLYFAITRGWVGPEGSIESPLDGAECATSFKRLSAVDLPVHVSHHPTSRYSLVSVEPETGRTHQIRRHFAHLRHPLIGDTIYGDGKHNRFFRGRIPSGGLFLKAYAIAFRHPQTGEPIYIRSRWNRPWLEAFDLFGVCPSGPYAALSASPVRT